jgi:hypothetical protein
MTSMRGGRMKLCKVRIMQYVLILIFSLLNVNCLKTNTIKLLPNGEDNLLLEVNNNTEVLHLRKKVKNSDVWLVGSDQLLQKYETEVCEPFNKNVAVDR